MSEASPNGNPLALPVLDSSGVGEARRAAAGLAGRLGFDEVGEGRVALVVTELAENLARHAKEGLVLARPLQRDGAGGLEIVALDRGPGFADVGRALEDGYSTAGTPGNGLGAVRRRADRFDLYSQPGSGTAVLARLWAKPPEPPVPGGGLEFGVVCLPKPGRDAPGDGWAAGRAGRFLLVDGLGSGQLAAEAALAAVRAYEAAPDLGPAGALELIHAALRHTRGAVGAVAAVDRERGVVRFAGVGNVAASVVAPGAGGEPEGRGLASLGGILGGEVRKVLEFELPWPPGAILVMHSDGLSSGWRLGRYPGLAARDPALVAAILYRDFARGSDDAAVLVARDAA